jgi:hypothetical protein
MYYHRTQVLYVWLFCEVQIKKNIDHKHTAHQALITHRLLSLVVPHICYSLTHFEHKYLQINRFWYTATSLTHELFRPWMCSMGVTAHVDRVGLCLWTAATNRPTVHVPDDVWVWSHDAMILTGTNWKLGENLSHYLFVHHKSHMDLTDLWANLASMVTGQQLTTWTMAWP